jgi:hypothetical protein
MTQWSTIRSVSELNSSRGHIYRPVWAAQITVPIMGSLAQRQKLDKSEDVITFPAMPKGFSLDRNDHNQADTCNLTLDWTTAGVDARMLDDATVELHVGDADESGFWVQSERTCRFIGVVKEIDSSRSADDAAEVTLDLVDYTDLFLKAKPFGSSGIPAFSQTLREAWMTIVSQTPGADVFNDPKRLVFEGVIDPDTIIGQGVAERFRKIGKVQTKPETDGWAVWQQCVGMLGLISYIDKDRCIVTTATNYYTEQDAPKMVWGHNLESWHESRVSTLSRRGIALTSFDPLSLRTIEASWPPIGDDRVKRKRAKTKKVQTEDKIRPTEERDYFAFPGVQEYESLLEIAKRVYEERSRQELEGSISTPHMYATTENGEVFDLLDLRAGDTVKVDVEPGMRQLLGSLGSDLERVNYLMLQGYADSAAQLIVANMKNFADLDARFLTKRVHVAAEVTDTGGSFSIDIDYINRIQIDGSAKP